MVTKGTEHDLLFRLSCSCPSYELHTDGDGAFQSGAASLQNISNDIQLFNKNGNIHMWCSDSITHSYTVFLVFV